MKKKLIASILAATMVLSTAACGDTATNATSEDTSKNSEVSSEAAESSETVVEEEFSYPMTGKDKITWWLELSPTLGGAYANLADTPGAKELSKQTGIEVEYIHPASGQTNDAFSLMLAEAEFPDIIQYGFAKSYDGGPEQAIADGVIVPLNDIIDKYCPNLKAFLEANPDVDKMIKTDNGTYYCFPSVMEVQDLGTSQGIIIRKDYLDAVKEEVPESLDDWYRVLTKFKDELKVTSPWCSNWGGIRGGSFMYSFELGSYQLGLDGNGKVVYGAITDNYKEYMQLMKQWYDEGLIDPDITTIKSDLITSRMTSGEGGSNYAWAGSGMQAVQLAGKELTPGFEFAACPYPSNNGVAAKAGYTSLRYSGMGASITTDCKDIEAVARFLDFGYSVEGRRVYNYGVEGESYTMVNGVPTYTDVVLKNPDGLGISAAISAYARSTYAGPFVQELNYYTQYLQEPSVKLAPSTWTVDTAADYILPSVTLTPEEAEEAATILADVNTYVNETVMKFFLGTMSFDEWDTFVKEAKAFGLDRAIEIYQNAYDRFITR